jgi:hypothetical protein
MKRLVQPTLLLLLTTPAFAADDYFIDYEKQFFSEEEKPPVNGAFYTIYAISKARQALSLESESTLIAEGGAVESAGGDVSIGGVILEPGTSVDGDIIIIGKIGDVTVGTGRR